MTHPSTDRPAQGELPLGAPEYLRVLDRYKDLDPEMVRLSADETCLLTGLSKKTLEAMRTEGRGPAFLKMARRIEYRLSDVKAFMDGARFQSTREAKTARRAGGSR